MQAPWIITSGTSGAAEIAGRATQGVDPDGPPVPLIGVVPYGIAAQRDNFDPTAGDGGKRRSRRYVWGSQPDALADVDHHQTRSLDANHTHFVLADNGIKGKAAYSSELKLRYEVENTVCSHVWGCDSGAAHGAHGSQCGSVCAVHHSSYAARRVLQVRQRRRRAAAAALCAHPSRTHSAHSSQCVQCSVHR